LFPIAAVLKDFLCLNCESLSLCRSWMRLECSNLTECNTFIRNFVRTLEFCDFGEKVFREAFFSAISIGENGKRAVNLPKALSGLVNIILIFQKI